MILATVIGVSLGLAAGWSRWAGYVIDPWLTILYSTPMVALAPLLILVFGIDLSAKAMIVFLFAVFPVAINTLAGVQTTANRYLRVARSFSASQPKILQSVVIPGSLPYVLTGLRVGGGHAIVGIVVAELLASDQGIGFLLSIAGATFQTGELLFLVTVLGLGGMAYAALIKRLEERMERWRPVVQRGAGARQ
jgi:NitT/TauT family transport system permease protein